MPTNCEIIFDNNPKRVYYGGQTVCGKVHLKLAKEKIVRGKYLGLLDIVSSYYGKMASQLHKKTATKLKFLGNSCNCNHWPGDPMHGCNLMWKILRWLREVLLIALEHYSHCCPSGGVRIHTRNQCRTACVHCQDHNMLELLKNSERMPNSRTVLIQCCSTAIVFNRTEVTINLSNFQFFRPIVSMAMCLYAIVCERSIFFSRSFSPPFRQFSAIGIAQFTRGTIEHIKQKKCTDLYCNGSGIFFLLPLVLPPFGRERSISISLVLFYNETAQCVLMNKLFDSKQWYSVWWVTGIYIEFLGKAQCQWTEGTGNKKETHTGTEIYLENRHYFIGGRTGKLRVIRDTFMEPCKKCLLLCCWRAFWCWVSALVFSISSRVNLIMLCSVCVLMSGTQSERRPKLQNERMDEANVMLHVHLGYVSSLNKLKAISGAALKSIMLSLLFIYALESWCFLILLIHVFFPVVFCWTFRWIHIVCWLIRIHLRRFNQVKIVFVTIKISSRMQKLKAMEMRAHKFSTNEQSPYGPFLQIATKYPNVAIKFLLHLKYSRGKWSDGQLLLRPKWISAGANIFETKCDTKIVTFWSHSPPINTLNAGHIASTTIRHTLRRTATLTNIIPCRQCH